MVVEMTADILPTCWSLCILTPMSSVLFRVCLLVSVLLASQLRAADSPSNQLSPEEKRQGWKLLFNGENSQGWHAFKRNSFPTNGWTVQDGWFECLGKSGTDIVSEDEYDQFDLQWDWKIEPAGNSGLKYFVLDTRSSALGHEYQMLDDEKNPDGRIAQGKHVTASFYDVLKPTVTPPTKPVGEINHSRILVQGNHVEHWLNGTKVLEYDCGSDAVKAAVAASKFKSVPEFGNRVKGHLLLQDHHSRVWFRNIKLLDLSGK
jgi:hypothetical protein